MTTDAFVAEHLTKSFSGTLVLRDVGFVVRAGEIVALLGQNGSGKSTLIKLLTGFHAPDSTASAKVTVGGETQSLPLHLDLTEFRIAAVHQDLAVEPTTSVAENLLINRMGGRGFYPIRWRRLHEQAAQLLSAIGVTNISTHALLQDLRPVDRARVAIARAVAEVGDGGLLILDEVTAFLTQDSVAELFDVITQLAAAGTRVLFVSHRLEEVRRLCSRALVLRNGSLVADVDLNTTTEEELVTAIIGQQLAWLYPEKHACGDDITLRVRIDRARGLGASEFEARSGEIVGVTGLRGMGHENLPYVLYGEDSTAEGSVEVEGTELRLGSLSPDRAYGAGLRLVPSERLKNAAAARATVAENASLPVLNEFVRLLALSHRRESDWVEGMISKYEISPPDGAARFDSLSGGNQQKVVVGRWLETTPRVLLLDEPTQGVDVGARRAIFTQVVDAAKGGVTVIYSTTEVEDLAELCHRVLVFRDGRIVAELTGEDVTEHRINQLSWSSRKRSQGTEG